MHVKHVNGLNLYTDKVPIQGGYDGDTTKNGRAKVFKRCDYCDKMRSPKSFGKLVRNICKYCVKKITEVKL